LRGLRRSFPYYVRKLKQERAERAARSKERRRAADAVLSKMRQEIARGMDRNDAIVRARDGGVTLQAIGEVVGLTTERVRQIVKRLATGGSKFRKNRNG
jgi:DNA-directed RNA polymerase sigma subunit (sigma70/sigma32)